MIREVFFSGHCKTSDCSRMVTVELDGNELAEVDCCYVNCPYTASCCIAQKIRLLTHRGGDSPENF